MTDVIQDLPTPDVADVQQVTMPAIDAVAVAVDGVVNVRNVPNKKGASTSTTIGTTPQKVLWDDDRRAVATLICESEFSLMNKNSGMAARWPADVPCVITHTSAVWAKSAATAELTVITESWAD